MQPHFSISTLCPGYVFDPPAFLPSPGTPVTLSESLHVAFDLCTGKLKAITNEPPGVDLVAGPYLDIRDVISMYLWCLSHPKECDQ